MNHIKYIIIFFVFLFSLNINYANDVDTIKKIYYFKLFSNIDQSARRLVNKAISDANDVNADLIIMHLNTYGGTLVDADSIRTAFLHSRIPIWVLVDNNAASAGALISIAANKIFMVPGSTIGAATVVDQTSQALPDKYQSYMRAMMRSTAIARGRDPNIAEAMVDPDIYIPGIIDSGKVLTFTAQEALKYGFCDNIVQGLDDLITKNNLQNAQIIKMRVTWLDKVINFFLNPLVSAILIMLIIAGIYFELQTPGIGFPLILAILAAVLYFVPYYIEGLAANWEILIFIIGIILVLVELFAIPGFGITGISGIILILAGLILTLVDNKGFHFPEHALEQLGTAFVTVTIAVFVGFTASILLSKRLFTQSVFGQNLSLTTEMKSENGYISSDLVFKNLIGQTATTHTVLRPSGKIIIGDDVYDAICLFSYIDKDKKVKIIDYQNNQLIVEPYE
ncbi:MAG: NfeD family protein [Bacteroidales bacterium]|jgi:membrane-bound serine protease (ClpP class)|nr:ATP-dependent Clp protease proteolytic subunit [Bacteroidales bacterium]MDI9575696.1 NfeD family protein [Bacteroidota bacterium]MDD2594132.1 NfeD family protein [Bacteroidales bacterium]MDD3756069.1 NfeD family protein [Bacteroidales bacterium]MDY0400222.1 NfeD family protein [Bacteroidales bacterium]